MCIHNCLGLLSYDRQWLATLEAINVRPAFFYTKPIVYNSVAICLIMIKLLHDTV